MSDALARHQRVGVHAAHHHPADARRPGWRRCRGAGGRCGSRAPGSRTAWPPPGPPGSPPGRPARRGARRTGRASPWPMMRPSFTMHGPHQGVGAGPAHAPLRQLQPPGAYSPCRPCHRLRKKKCPEPDGSGHREKVGNMRPSRSMKTKTPRNDTHSRANVHGRRNTTPCGHTIFFHPDCTVGLGISPNHALRLVGCTTGGELHPALKTLIRFLPIIPPRQGNVNPLCGPDPMMPPARPADTGTPGRERPIPAAPPGCWTGSRSGLNRILSDRPPRPPGCPGRGRASPSSGRPGRWRTGGPWGCPRSAAR